MNQAPDKLDSESQFEARQLAVQTANLQHRPLGMCCNLRYAMLQSSLRELTTPIEYLGNCIACVIGRRR